MVVAGGGSLAVEIAHDSQLLQQEDHAMTIAPYTAIGRVKVPPLREAEAIQGSGVSRSFLPGAKH